MLFYVKLFINSKHTTYLKEVSKEKIKEGISALYHVDENSAVQKVEISEGLRYGCSKAAIRVLRNPKFHYAKGWETSKGYSATKI